MRVVIRLRDILSDLWSGRARFMERRFRREISELECISEFIAEFIEGYRISEDHSFTLNLIIEEMFTNLVKYNLDGRQEIAIDLRMEDREAVIALTDFDIHDN